MTLRVPALLLLLFAASPGVQYFRYQRPVLNTPAQKQQACLTLDPTTFAHAGPRLASLRLYSGAAEVPYAIRSEARAQSPADNLTPLNAGVRGGGTTFDAAMPEGLYSNVELDVAAKDFIATVRVSGSQNQASAHPTNLGSYTIFDFTRQKLGRSTVLHLPPSNFRYLHFRIDGVIRPSQITGLSAGNVPQTEPQYITVATTSSVKQKGRDSILEFTVPANVPVDRVLFAPGAQPVNFSRGVTLTRTPAAKDRGAETIDQEFPVFSTGNILRIHTRQNGRKIDEEHLAVDAPSFAPNYATTWTVAVHNEDDAPLDLQSVSLQMIARTLCFAAEPGASYTLYYGDDALTPPSYDYAKLFALDKDAAQASLGLEQPNPQYQPRPDTRPFTEKHPALLWTALIVAILLLGGIALRSSRQIRQP